MRSTVDESSTSRIFLRSMGEASAPASGGCKAGATHSTEKHLSSEGWARPSRGSAVTRGIPDRAGGRARPATAPHGRGHAARTIGRRPTSAGDATARKRAPPTGPARALARRPMVALALSISVAASVSIAASPAPRPDPADAQRAAERDALRALAAVAAREPSIDEVQDAAERVAEASVVAAPGFARRARLAALLPRVTAEYKRDERSYRVVGLQSAGMVDYERLSPVSPSASARPGSSASSSPRGARSRPRRRTRSGSGARVRR